MNRQSQSAAVWLVVALLLLSYPFSIGPVGWVIIQCGSPAWTEPAFSTVYAPIIWLQDHSPEPLRGLISWYLKLWWG